jgi:hypothetical protein
MKPRVKLWIALGLVLTACNRGGDAKPDAGPTASASAAAPIAPGAAPIGSAPWLAVPSATAATLPNMSFPERFQTEAASRPALKPRVEDVLAAFKTAGLDIVEPKQHLASPLGARYCVGARAIDGAATLFQLSVCEYLNADVAAKSAAFSETAMKTLLPTRTVRARNHLGLVVLPDANAPGAQAAVEKAHAVFAKL